MDNYEIPITISTIEPTSLDYIQTIREDLSKQFKKVLTEGDVHAHLIASVIQEAVFISCIVEDSDGNFRSEDITPESIYEIYKLKQLQATPEKGAWISVSFRSDAQGFVESTHYNYTQKIYSGSTPEEWFIPPASGDSEQSFLKRDDVKPGMKLYVPVWDEDDYFEELNAFPRSNGSKITSPLD